MNSDTGISLVISTTSNLEEAKYIAAALIENRMAVCCNIVPGITSVYLWEGKTNIDEEFLLLIKTSAEQVDTVVEKVKKIHSYDVPEIIVLPIIGGSRDYIDWVKKCRGD
ncbi:MAG: divalent-cation tolerance protein CutA [candidate division Zixibacteria bacterium]|nr:divalent-cation tolerance protein CutA [candidate division Zixibacteria bacterium]